MPSVSPAGKRRRGPAGVIGRRLFWEEFMWLQDIFLDEEDFVTTTPLYNDISSPPPDPDIFLDEEDFVTTTPLYNDISSPPPDA